MISVYARKLSLLNNKKSFEELCRFFLAKKKRESLYLVTELDVTKLSTALKEVLQLLRYVGNLCDILHVFHTQGAFNFLFLWLSFLLSFYFQLFINISSLTSSKCTELKIVQGWLFLIPILFNQFLSIFYGSLPLLKWPSV